MRRLNKKGITFLELLVSLVLISLVLIFLMVLLSNIKNDKNTIATNKVQALINQTEIVKDIQEKLRGENVYNVQYYTNSDAGKALDGNSNFSNRTILVINYRDSYFENGFVLVVITSNSISVNKFDNAYFDSLKSSAGTMFNDEDKTTWYSTFINNGCYNYTGVTIDTYNSSEDLGTWGIFEKTSTSFGKIVIPYTFDSEVCNLIGEGYESSPENTTGENYDIEITLYNESDTISVKRIWGGDFLKVNGSNSADNANKYGELISKMLLEDYGYDVDYNPNSSENEIFITNYIMVKLDCNKNDNCPILEASRNIQELIIRSQIKNEIATDFDLPNIQVDWINIWGRDDELDKNKIIEIVKKHISDAENINVEFDGVNVDVSLISKSWYDTQNSFFKRTSKISSIKSEIWWYFAKELGIPTTTVDISVTTEALSVEESEEEINKQKNDLKNRISGLGYSANVSISVTKNDLFQTTKKSITVKVNCKSGNNCPAEGLFSSGTCLDPRNERIYGIAETSAEIKIKNAINDYYGSFLGYGLDVDVCFDRQ